MMIEDDDAPKSLVGSMNLRHECRADGCTEKLVTDSERFTGFCFKCGDGEYHGSDYRSIAWREYIGERA